MKYVYVCMLCLLLAGCVSGPTVMGHYKLRENRCFGLLSKYEKVPERYVSGGAGSIKDKEGNEATRSKAAAIVDIGSILSSTQPTTEVK